eukprot:NODE_204_length_12954_cov_1.347880.p8 type:complete len:161 gc:universal NODE_204_length_12954_cov_1.347880:7044-7526(+)
MNSLKKYSMVSTDQLQVATIVHNALYNTDNAELQHQAFQFISDDCQFVNPIVHLSGKKQIDSNFSLSSRFSPNTKVLSITSTNQNIVIIDCLVTWNFFFNVKFRHLTKMNIKSSKVVFIEDVWSVQDMISGIPLIGAVYKSLLPHAGTFFSKWGSSFKSE